ncbi:alpha/beta fold hydrolase [Streptomyces sp. ISL-14]|nr:alpha/beta fold hydrolase [Streptomyces sp. ISL-14]
MSSSELRDYRSETVTLFFRNPTGSREVYASWDDTVLVEGTLLARPDVKQDTVIVFMHPMGPLHNLPLTQELARRGAHVFCANTRYPNNDAALIMENVLVDLGQWVRYLREERGYAKVVIGGWSGGGSVATTYQAQAEKTTITHTPAGDPVDLSGLIPGEAVLQLCAHISRAALLTDSLDASIIDENDPFRRNPDLDLYGKNAPKAPYSADFVAEYRKAQLERSRRITAWVKERLAEPGPNGEAGLSLPFVVYGTMADPRWLDTTLEPNERQAGTSFIGIPSQVNNSPIALGRYTSLRSWLSQWSIDETNVNTVKFGHQVTVPALVLTAGGDNAVPTSHADLIQESLGGEVARHHLVGANHYLRNQPEQLAEAAITVLDWLEDRGLHAPVG